MSVEDIDAIEYSIREAKITLATKEALVRLMNNNDFKNVILDGYLRKESYNITMSLRNDNDEFMKLMAISQFNQYLQSVMEKGSLAEKDIEGANQLKKMIEAE